MFGLFQNNSSRQVQSSKLQLTQFDQLIAPANVSIGFDGALVVQASAGEQVTITDNGTNLRNNLTVTSNQGVTGLDRVRGNVFTRTTIIDNGAASVTYNASALGTNMRRDISYSTNASRSQFVAILDGIGLNGLVNINANTGNGSDIVAVSVRNIGEGAGFNTNINTGSGADLIYVSADSVGRSARTNYTLNSGHNEANETENVIVRFWQIQDSANVVVNASGGSGSETLETSVIGRVGLNASVDVRMAGMSGADSISLNVRGKAEWGSIISARLLGNVENSGHIEDGTNLISFNYEGENDGRILYNLQAGGGWGGFGDWLRVGFNFALDSRGEVGNERDDTSTVFGGRTLNDMNVFMSGAGRDQVRYNGLRMVGVNGARDIFNVSRELYGRPGLVQVYQIENFNSSDGDTLTLV